MLERPRTAGKNWLAVVFLFPAVKKQCAVTGVKNGKTVFNQPPVSQKTPSGMFGVAILKTLKYRI
ncbi:MAG: hypothetical protein KHZ10_08880 [Clostridium sp.]|nr:hypothetical protein [Clostridium sp.]